MEQLKTYQIIYADPPWPYDNMKNCDPKMGGITYPVMTMEQLGKLPVRKIAEPDCALFMWATMPKLREALWLIDKWGFEYITDAFTWVKLNPKGKGIYSGLGHWTNGNAELCLFAKTGAPKRVAKNVKQIIMAPRSRHSEKPPETRDRIVSLMGDISRIELFARTKTPGWDAWGNEIESDIKLEARHATLSVKERLNRLIGETKPCVQNQDNNSGRRVDTDGFYGGQPGQERVFEEG